MPFRFTKQRKFTNPILLIKRDGILKIEAELRNRADIHEKVLEYFGIDCLEDLLEDNTQPCLNFIDRIKERDTVTHETI